MINRYNIIDNYINNYLERQPSVLFLVMMDGIIVLSGLLFVFFSLKELTAIVSRFAVVNKRLSDIEEHLAHDVEDDIELLTSDEQYLVCKEELQVLVQKLEKLKVLILQGAPVCLCRGLASDAIKLLKFVKEIDEDEDDEDDSCSMDSDDDEQISIDSLVLNNLIDRLEVLWTLLHTGNKYQILCRLNTVKNFVEAVISNNDSSSNDSDSTLTSVDSDTMARITAAVDAQPNDQLDDELRQSSDNDKILQEWAENVVKNQENEDDGLNSSTDTETLLEWAQFSVDDDPERISKLLDNNEELRKENTRLRLELEEYQDSKDMRQLWLLVKQQQDQINILLAKAAAKDN